MVIAEFFGYSPIDNTVSVLANRPDTAVFVGDLKKIEKYDPVFLRFLRKTGNLASELEQRSIRAFILTPQVEIPCPWRRWASSASATGSRAWSCSRTNEVGVSLKNSRLR